MQRPRTPLPSGCMPVVDACVFKQATGFAHAHDELATARDVAHAFPVPADGRSGP